MRGLDCIAALKALGEPNRLRMVRLLLKDQLCVNENPTSPAHRPVTAHPSQRAARRIPSSCTDLVATVTYPLRKLYGQAD